MAKRIKRLKVKKRYALALAASLYHRHNNFTWVHSTLVKCLIPEMQHRVSYMYMMKNLKRMGLGMQRTRGEVMKIDDWTITRIEATYAKRVYGAGPGLFIAHHHENNTAWEVIVTSGEHSCLACGKELDSRVKMWYKLMRLGDVR